MMTRAEKMRQYRKTWENKHWENRLWNNAKRNARVKGKAFDIEVSDLVIPEYCPILGLALIKGSIEKHKNSNALASLDCINPEKGYIKGNVWVISFLANKMKQNASREELILFANGILKCIDDDLI